ncbi:MAG: hypothetical protein P8Q46_04175 [Candidatus Thalassarchaeaceae archaeon]|nr:hypothetical protein [Candidatus Thalassarchaeaceae archaeon]
MGFKSRAKKRRQVSAGGKGGSANEEKPEFVGEVPCDIKGCDNWADKKAGGRKMAYDRAVEVWGSSGVSRKVRKISLCKPCYRAWKKENKGQPKEWE